MGTRLRAIILAMTSIYILTDPLGFDTAYVGRSTKPASRLRDHMNLWTRHRAMHQWLSALKARNLVPCMTVLDECADWEAATAERDAIAMVKAVRGADC